MINPFVWFVLTFLVALSNIIFSIVVYSFLSAEKKLNKHVKILKDIALLYAIGMMIAIIGSIALLAVIIGV